MDTEAGPGSARAGLHAMYYAYVLCYASGWEFREHLKIFLKSACTNQRNPVNIITVWGMMGVL